MNTSRQSSVRYDSDETGAAMVCVCQSEKRSIPNVSPVAGRPQGLSACGLAPKPAVLRRTLQGCIGSCIGLTTDSQSNLPARLGSLVCPLAADLLVPVTPVTRLCPYNKWVVQQA